MARKPGDPHSIADRLPSDDEVWAQYRTSPWAQVAAVVGVTRQALIRRMAARGWTRARSGWRITQAPCATCGRAFPVTDETTERRCDRCRSAVEPEAVPDWRANLEWGRSRIAARWERERQEGEEAVARLRERDEGRTRPGTVPGRAA